MKKRATATKAPSKKARSLSRRLKPVVAAAKGRTVICLVGDMMPRRTNIKNGSGIDLSPAAVAAIGKKPALMIAATWSWQDDE